MNSPSQQESALLRIQFSVNDQLRVEALREAVRARLDHEKPEATTARAVQFYDFLTSE